MVSYRTILFGAVAMVCAAAPAYADCAHAIPAPIHKAVSGQQNARTDKATIVADCAHAIPAPIHSVA